MEPLSCLQSEAVKSGTLELSPERRGGLGYLRIDFYEILLRLVDAH